MTSPDALRVETSFSGEKTGREFFQLVGKDLLRKRLSNFARSGFAFSHDANCPSHCFLSSAPRVFTSRTWARMSAGIAKLSSGLSPSACLVCSISDAPRAEPCDLEVPCAFGAGHAITVFNRISVGLVDWAIAFFIASSSATRSTSPFLRAGTSRTSQP
ncbi:unannotated protein [freshwater metagenome]|uniref:Unannotated protein n=1 Tax=freshwater metagenome TaxID=449393 RepID=A0A6J7BZV7_9ZZZZ